MKKIGVIIIGKFRDLTGQRFGKLVVIKRVENNKNNKVRWLCQCDCGNMHTTISYSLIKGLCRSCGCLQQEIIDKKQQRAYNTYDLSGEYGVGYTSKDDKFYFDLEDYNKIKDYCWHINSDGYVVTTINQTHSVMKMHRLVMDVLNNPNVYIDHIYHNKNDNRKSQLRLSTNQQNQFNTLISKNNTSGYKGVYWHKKHNQWEALISFNKKQIYLGLFDNIEDAIKARQQAEIKYFGEYRYRENSNSIQSNTQIITHNKQI